MYNIKHTFANRAEYLNNTGPKSVYFYIVRIIMTLIAIYLTQQSGGPTQAVSILVGNCWKLS